MSPFPFFQRGVANGSAPTLPLEKSPYSSVFHVVEGFALVILCSTRPATRRLAVSCLKEIRTLFTVLDHSKVSLLSYIIKWPGLISNDVAVLV